MVGRLFLLITVTTTVELALLLLAGRALGIVPTIAIIVATGLAGAFLAAREGRRAWRRVIESLGRGELPADSIVQALLVLAGGLLLLTPGYLTDITGFLCLLPPSRALLSRRIRRSLSRRIETGAIHGSWTSAAPGRGVSGDDTRRQGADEPRSKRVFDATDQQ